MGEVEPEEDSITNRVKDLLEKNPNSTSEDLVLDYWQTYQAVEFIDNKRDKLAKIETILRSRRKILKPSVKKLEQRIAEGKGWDLFERAEEDKTVKNNVHIDSCDCK